MLVGRSTEGRASLNALVDDIRLWKEARDTDGLQTYLFKSPPSDATALEALYELEEDMLVEAAGGGGKVVNPFLEDGSDQGRDSGSAEDRALAKVTFGGAKGLECSSTACRVELSDARVVCGDGIRAAAEDCDDGNADDGDGCSEECEVEDGFFCTGGDDLVSTDLCQGGALLLDEGFEKDDLSSAWGWKSGLRDQGDWERVASVKRSGSYGLRVSFKDELLEGCPNLVRYSGFRSTKTPDTKSGWEDTVGEATSNAKVVTGWPRVTGLPADPLATGRVLEIGTASERASSSVEYYPVGPAPTTLDKILWPTGSSSVTYRVSAYALAEKDSSGEMLWDGDQRLLRFRGYSSSNALLTTALSATLDSDDDHSNGAVKTDDGNAIVTTGRAFPTAAGVWQLVWMDVEVTKPISYFAADFGYSSSATGRVWLQDLAVTPHCPGIPPGVVAWLRADKGPVQTEGADVKTWPDQSGLGVDAISQNNHGDVMLDQLNGLPIVRIDQEAGYLFNNTLVKFERPFTVIAVTRYNENNWRGRLIQSPTQNFIVGHWSSRVGGYFNGWVWLQDYPSSSEFYLWRMYASEGASDENAFWFNAKEMARGGGSLVDPNGFVIGNHVGRYNERTTADIAEVLIFRRRLSKDEMANVHTYLAAKWGLVTDKATVSAADIGWKKTSLVPDLETDGRAADYSQATSDFYVSESLKQRFLSDPERYFTWGRRLVTGLDETAVFSLYTRLRRTPLRFGVPFWILLQDGDKPVRDPMHECSIKGSNCGETKAVRICANGGGADDQCDVIVDITSPQAGRLGPEAGVTFVAGSATSSAAPKEGDLSPWTPVTVGVTAAFRAKYGASTPAPKKLSITIVVSAPGGVAELEIDDIRVYKVSEVVAKSDPGAASAVSGTDCKALEARSLSGISLESSLVTSSKDAWEMQKADSSTLDWSVTSGGALRMHGTVASNALSASESASDEVDAEDETAIRVSTKDKFAHSRSESLSLRINSATDADADSAPRIDVCSGEASLAYNPTTSKWAYQRPGDGLTEPPSSYIQVLVDEKKAWVADRYRNLGPVIPWDEKCTYVFNYKSTGITNYWAGVFFRGGGTYIQPSTGDTVTSGADRQPAVWQRPHSTQLHIRQATTGHWNHGCDPPDLMEIGKWTHIAITLEPKLMQVFIDGNLRCATSFGTGNTRWVSENRNLYTVGYQSSSSVVNLDDFRYYRQALTSMQINKLHIQQRFIEAGSTITVGSGVFTNIRCIIKEGSVRLYEDGILRLDRELDTIVAQSLAERPLSFRVSTSPGAEVDVEVSGVAMRELRAVGTLPSFCAASGTYHAVIRNQFDDDNEDKAAAKAIQWADALVDAESHDWLSVTAALVSINSVEENDCVATLLGGCETAWIGVSDEATEGTWVYMQGVDKGKAVPSAVLDEVWADSQPTSSDYVVMHPGGDCSADGTTQFGEWGACTDNCAGVNAFVIEYTPSDSALVNLALPSLGAEVVANSPLLAIGTGSIDGSLAGTAEFYENMKYNLLVPAADRKPTLASGDKDFMFRDGAGATNQYVVIDLGSEELINRVGIEGSIDEDDRAVEDFVRVSSSTTSSTGPWTEWGIVGADDVKRDIVTRENFVRVKDEIAARYVKIEIGPRTGSVTLGSRLSRAYVQRVRGTLARLLVDDKDIGDDAAGLNVASVRQGVVQDVRNFSLVDDDSVRSFYEFVRDEVDEKDDVLLAARDIPSPSKLIFFEDFASPMDVDSVNRKRVEEEGRGVYQLQPGKTWNELKSYCEGQGYVMCPKEHVCRPPGFGWRRGYPHYGWFADADTWIAVGDAEDEFVAIGTLFTRDELCGDYSELKGSYPSEATQSSWDLTRVMCCRPQDQTGAPRWLIVHENSRNSTGRNNNLYQETRYPPVWRLVYSRLHMYGYPWGNEERSDYRYNNYWREEQCDRTFEQAGSSVVLNEPTALAWTDYRVRVDMYLNYRSGGLAFRWTKRGTYYRYLVDAERKCHTLVHSDGLKMRQLGSTIYRQTHARRWLSLEVTVTGNPPRIVVVLEGETIFDVVDDDETAHTKGTIALYTWMDYNIYFDNVEVHEVSSNAEAVANLTTTLQSLGATSSAGLLTGGSWSMVGRKGRTEGEAAVAFDDDGSVAESKRIFPCDRHEMTIPENFAASNALPVPLNVHAGVPVSDFSIVADYDNASEPNALIDVGAMGVVAESGQVFVANSSKLDRESRKALNLRAIARHERYDSGYFRFGAQASIKSFRELTHAMHISPAQLQVDVSIRPYEGANRHFSFAGHGARFATDYAWWHRHGGVLFAYSTDRVRIWAPTRNIRASAGNLVMMGHGWGGVYDNGVLQYEAKKQVSLDADVRVTVSRLSPPDFDSGWFAVQAGMRGGSYTNIRHRLGEYPGRIKVLLRATRGANAGFVFEAAGSAQADNDRWPKNPVGGAVFGYNDEEVRIWLADWDRFGAAIMVGQGWGGEEKTTSLKTVEARVVAWRPRVEPDFQPLPFSMVAGADAYREIEHGLGQVPGRLQVVASPKVGANAGYYFESQGMSQHSAYLTYWEYGGVLTAVNATHIRLWVPSPDPDASSYPSNDRGYSVYVYDGWGRNRDYAIEKIADIRVRAWRNNPDVLKESTPLFVNVSNVDEPPRAAGGVFQINENRPLNSIVASLNPIDGDCEADKSTCTLTSTVVSGNVDDAFLVDSEGKVRVKNASAVNYELHNAIALTVRVSDGKLVTYATARFELIDINDPPVLEKSTISIIEEAPRNSKVGRALNASDEDAGQVVTFSIVGGNDLGYFKIGLCDGQVRTTRPIDYEEHQNFTLQIMVTDDGKPIQNSTVAIPVNILNRNDPPTVPSQTIYIAENTLLGEKLGTPIVALDEDGDALTYEILAGDERSQFRLDNSTGQLYVARFGFLDYEAPESDGVGRFSIQIAASDAEFTAIGTVELVVVDAQDAPILLESTLAQSVDENSPVGTVVGTVSATDQDWNDTMRYSIESVDPPSMEGVLEIGQWSGEITVAEDRLNYEAHKVIRLTVRVRDTGGNQQQGPVLYDEGVVNVLVNDVNEAPTLEYAEFTISENVPFGTLVGALDYFDEDVMEIPVEERGLFFEIIDGDEEGAFGFGGGIFYPNNITIRRAIIDAETKLQYILTVMVTDDGEPELNATATVVINVRDENDPATVSCNQTLLDADTYEWRGGAGYDAIFTLLRNPNDPDSGDGVVAFRLDGDDGDGDGDDGDDGDTTTGGEEGDPGAGDVEDDDDAGVGVDDDAAGGGGGGGGGSGDGTTGEEVALEDLTTSEIRATDAEGWMNCRSLCNQRQSCRGYTYWSIAHPKKLLRGACVGRNDFSQMLVGSPAPSGPNAPAPIVYGEAKTRICLSATIEENSAQGTVVEEIIAVDDEGDEISYRVDPNSVQYELFAFDSRPAHANEIQVYNVSALNFERLPSPVLAKFEVEDAGSGRAFGNWLRVYVTDVPEAPYFGPHETRLRTVGEDSPAGTLLGPKLGGVEEDAGDSITWSIQGGDTNSYFTIDPSTGMLSTATKMPALDEAEEYDLVIRMQDTQGHVVDETVTARILNANRAPVVTQASATRSANESWAPGTPVTGKVLKATDADNNPIRFRLVESPLLDGLPMLDIDAESGAILVGAGGLDFESMPVVTATMEAYDLPPDLADSLSTPVEVSVTVLNAPEPPEARNVRIFTPENVEGGVQIGANVTWRDPDDGDAPFLKFRIIDLDGAPPGMFTITYYPDEPAGADGKGRKFGIFLGKGFGFTAAEDADDPDLNLNFERRPTYKLKVRVSDAVFSATGIVTVQLTDVREPPTLLDADLAILERDSGYRTGAVVGDIPVHDEDANTTFYWAITVNQRLGGFDAFGIASSGVGRVFALPSVPIDFEDRQSLFVTVEVRDSNDPATWFVAQKEYEISVLDDNDVEVVSARAAADAPEGADALDPAIVDDEIVAAQEEAARHMRTMGGTEVLLLGRNFGWTAAHLAREPSFSQPTFSVSYGGEDGTRYEATGCVRVGASNRALKCSMIAGVGADLPIRVSLTYDEDDGMDHATPLYVSGSESWLPLADTRLSYTPPVILSISGAGQLDTAGGETVTLSVENAGPTDHEFSAPQATYEVPGLTPLYRASSCVVTVDDIAVACQSAPGVGSNHTWRVALGGQWSVEQLLPSAYRPPSVTDVEVIDNALAAPMEGRSSSDNYRATLRSAGGSQVRIRGTSLGPRGSHQLRAHFGPGGAALPGAYFDAPCTLETEHTSMICTTPPGVGGNHTWRALVAGQVSKNPSTAVTSYEVPRLDDPSIKPTAVSGAGAFNATTEGGEFVLITGEGFGPTASLLPPNLAVAWDVTYGKTGWELRAQHCVSMSNDGSLMRCETAPGTGAGHSWRARPTTCNTNALRNSSMHSLATTGWVGSSKDGGGLRLGVCGGWGSDIVYLGTSYANPVIASVTGAGSLSDTRGGSEIVISGLDFGPSDDTFDWARYSFEDRAAEDVLAGQPIVMDPSTNTSSYQLPDPWSTAVHFPRGKSTLQARDCRMTEPHREIRCNTAPGAGAPLKWELSVDGLISVSLRYAYEPPSITRLEGARVGEMRTEGGDVIRIIGENLGSSAFLGNVTYGPVSSPFIAVDCKVITPHYVIECKTSPGAGAGLAWRVTVGGQTSLDSDQTGDRSTSAYEAPVVEDVSPLYLLPAEEVDGHVTSGGVRMVVKGRGFGPPGGAVAILWGSDGAAPSSCLAAQEAIRSGASDNADSLADYERLPRGCALVVSQSHNEIRFDTPPGQGFGLNVQVYVTGAYSNPFQYSYSPPVLTRLTAVEPDTLGGPWRLLLEGRNFGADGRVVVKPIRGGSPLETVDHPEAEILHTSAVVFIAEDEGSVYVDAGGQLSNTRIFTQASPIIEDMQVSEGVDGSGQAVPVGATRGGFRFNFLLQNLGRVQDPAWRPSIRITIGGRECVLDPLKGRQRGETYELDELVYEIVGDTIASGTVECTAPAGAGADQPVIVWRLNSEINSEAGESIPRLFSYLPPSDITFVGDGASPSRGGSPTHWVGARAGNQVVLRGQNLFTGVGPGALEVNLIATSQWLAGGDESGETRRRNRMLLEAEGEDEEGSFELLGSGRMLQSSTSFNNESSASSSAVSQGPNAYRGSRDDVVAFVSVEAEVTVPHEEVTLTIPAWQGEDLVLEILVGGQVASPETTMDYDKPDFGFLIGSGGGGGEAVVRSTEGGTEITITGVGFGEYRPDLFLSPPQIVGGVTVTCYSCVMVGGVEATCDLWSDTRLECFSPASQGEDQSIIVVAAGHASALTSDRVFSYDPPSIASSSGPWEFDTDGLVPRSDEVARLRSIGEETLANYVAGVAAVEKRSGVEMIRALMVLEGVNFGTGEDSISAVLIGESIVVPARSARVIEWSHSRVVIEAPEGEGFDLDVRVDAGGQPTEVIDGLQLSYNPPFVTSVSPRSFPTDACHKWEPVTTSNRGIDASGIPIRMCCQPAMITITGGNLGRLGFADITVDNTVVRRTCEESYDEGPVWADSYPARTGHACPAECSNVDGRYALEHPAACDERDCCRYEAYPRRLDDAFYCPCPVPSGACVVSQTHTEIKVRPPPGFGADRPLKIRVGGQDATPRRVSYDAPEVRFVLPTPYDADGNANAQLRIEGKNFGTLQSNLSVTLDTKECKRTKWTIDSRGITAGGLPYITCNAPRDVVGAKEANISVSGRVGTVDALEAKFVSECRNGMWGRVGELCLDCPMGASCEGGTSDPYSQRGWWERQVPRSECPKERKNRKQCPLFIPCEPKDACTGNNTCAFAYTGERCAECIDGFYRLQGECVECPDNAWLVMVFAAVGALCAAGVALVLNAKNFNLAVTTIAVDYFQVLAIFATARISWPDEIRTLFHIMSAFNLNLELAVPECTFPGMSYTYKYLGILGLPIAAAFVFLAFTFTLTAYKRCILKYPWKEANRHAARLTSSLLTMIYFLYLYVTRTTFEVYNCAPTDPPDGYEPGYMQAVFEPCMKEGGVHMDILPFGVLSTLVYVIGYPAMIAVILYRNRDIIELSQVLRAKGLSFDPHLERDRFLTWQRYSRLFYMFKPRYFAWVMVIIMRKFLVAVSALLFNRIPAFQMAVLLLIVFLSYVLTVLVRPYMSPFEYEDVAKAWDEQERIRAEENKLLHKAGLAKGTGGSGRGLLSKSSARGKLAEGATSTTWTTAKRRKSLFRQDRLALSVARDVDKHKLGKASIIEYDYNMVEATLLCCAVFVTLSGLMFESGRLEGEYYSVQRITLTWLVILTVSSSLIFLCVIFSMDIAAFMKPESRIRYCNCLIRRPKAKRDLTGTVAAMLSSKSEPGEDGEEGGDGGGGMAIQNAANPLMGGEVKGELIDSKEAVTKTAWEYFCSEYERVQDELYSKKAEVERKEKEAEERKQKGMSESSRALVSAESWRGDVGRKGEGRSSPAGAGLLSSAASAIAAAMRGGESKRKFATMTRGAIDTKLRPKRSSKLMANPLNVRKAVAERREAAAAAGKRKKILKPSTSPSSSTAPSAATTTTTTATGRRAPPGAAAGRRAPPRPAGRGRGRLAKTKIKMKRADADGGKKEEGGETGEE